MIDDRHWGARCKPLANPRFFELLHAKIM